jgi:tRNA(adenine34) deaminase
MQEALKEAQIAFEEDEVPIGAVLVHEKKIIAKGRNSVEVSALAMNHAEVNCLKEGAKILKNWRLINTTLYVTVEPCIMCIGAIILSRVKKVIWGCPDLRHGGCGSITNLLTLSHPIHQVVGQGGLLEEEAKELLQTFFKKKRNNERSFRKTF